MARTMQMCPEREGVRSMVTREIRDRAARLGLSAWVTYAIAATRDGRERMLELKCVGFSSADLALAEGETWSEVFDEAARIIFCA